MSSTSQSPLPTLDIMRDIFLWRKKKQSLLVLVVSTATCVLLEVYQFNFLTVVSWLAMFIVVSLFLWGNLVRLLGKEPPNLLGLEITEESTIKLAMALRTWTEEGIRWMFRVGAQRDLFSFALTVGGLWLFSQVANYFDLLTLLYTGIIMGMTIPPVYVKYEDKIKRCNERVKKQLKRYYDSFDEKVMKKVKTKVGTTTTTTTTIEEKERKFK
ncbi:Reticulon-like protein [Morus notabilis]|uniref:Reticulon-like protein n=1 Tax=Morus notabilis TaxID=981085 RepID=W9SBQ4_9ROSA|nr:reticulon-like protein B13 [Morus notabilis]EXC24856.1 Reticulon-like protein [Morus notabilis]